MSGKAPVVRYEKNPFIDNMVIPVKGRSIKLSKMGKEENVLINSSTGEVHGTHVTTYKKVDSKQFVKLFTDNIALTFDLKSAGIKTLNVLLWNVQKKGIEKDLIPLDKYVLKEFVDVNRVQLSQATFARGLAELEKAKIIAKQIRQGWYFINPNFCFNGDRIAFTTMIERKTGTEEKQEELPLI